MLWLLLLLLCGLLGGRVQSVCPTMCSCSQGHRVVDCSSRGLTKLPHGLQHNIHFLNLSFNSLQGLDSQLSHYVHLRTLDLSYNRLESLPPALPRSLWDIRAAGNHLRSLDKNNTAYHWNLKLLDLSDNELERVVFINNTLPGLKALNLSHNRFWTVPTNMPRNLETIDLSHNYLVQILPGSLDQLHRLAQFYLHSNHFSWLTEGIFDKLTGLQVMSLGDNPWACEEEDNITKLLSWAEQSRATILGCPCYTRAVCGQAHQSPLGREWHSALYTEPPLWVERYVSRSPDRTAEDTLISDGKHTPFATRNHQDKRGNTNNTGDHLLFLWTSSTTFDSLSTHRSTTTARPRSAATKPKAESSQNNGNRLHIETQLTVTLTISFMTTTFNVFGNKIDSTVH
ncbi:oligodendrocyte-myelin glycoprotein-like isoform X3 [Thalassophryne amazonica]|uniref:oligodendrocyte-myelin glycoprotein-like isoform X3 n=1 Tax=Thalassophryne amazonica TaxID=390379 RepID=UPI001471C600|nr:oligodendrocyte-myelin glycoprotein-like isoform X3 [Thalassophryne amazonica]